MTIPAIREMRRIFPNARITLHTRAWAQGIFQDAEFIDEILPIEAKETIFQQAQKLKEKRFDLAVLFTNSFQTALVAKLGKAKKRFGYANEGRSFLLTGAIKIPEWKNARHEVFYYLNLVAEVEKQFFGETKVGKNEPRFDLEISETRKVLARKCLEENGVDLAKKTIALGVGSTNSRAKRWHAERYASLNDKLQNELNANVILIGAEEESDISQEVFEKSQKKPTILTGKTDLAAAAAILSVIDLLVSNDMGLAHIAPAVGAKTLVIFGPTNELTTQPLGSEIIRRNVECSPCMLRDCPIDHRCMTQIAPDEVFIKAKKMLSADKKR